MNALEPLRVHPTTVKGQLHAVAMATVVEDVIKEQKDRLRGLLEGEVRRLSEETGAAFTARVGGMGTAVLTDPQPKPSISDQLVFGRWLAEHADPDGALGLWASRERVVVNNHAQVAAALSALADGRDIDAADLLAEAVEAGGIEVITEFLPSESALDEILAKRWVTTYYAGDLDGWELRTLDPETGDLGDVVPGTSVSCAKQTLQVKLDAAARKQAKAEVREALGLPEIGGGQ